MTGTLDKNRKEKDGGIGCRAWYFNLNDWVEQNVRLPDIAKAQNASESEAKDEEMEEASSQEKEAPKMVEDNSIPVGETAGDVCNVCMDPLDQYWDEEREEWRYRKSVRENYKTYHYHCFVDYIPFEDDEDCTPPETPSFPQSPSLVTSGQHDIKKNEMHFDISASRDMSSVLDETITHQNDNLQTVSSDSNTSKTLKPTRLTTSMLEVLKTGDENDIDEKTASMEMIVETTDDKESVAVSNSMMDYINPGSVSFKSENEVINTLQDLLRVASGPENNSFASNQKRNKCTMDNTLPDGGESCVYDEQVVRILLVELIEAVSNEIHKPVTPHFLPGADILGITTETTTASDNKTVIRTRPCKLETNFALNGIDSCSTVSQNDKVYGLDNSECESASGIDCNKKEMDDECEIAYSPYIENCDSPVYPVITTSHLACVEDEDSAHEFSFLPHKTVAPDDATIRHVADTMDFLLEKVTLGSKGELLNTTSSFNTVELCIGGTGSNSNISVNEVSNDGGVDG